ncbi:MAG: tyrosine-type recombinase/integrase [Actinobacteria bacterium]|nr:tyrosine-type recombinase/integrase [Actinomycetota bacterium]
MTTDWLESIDAMADRLSVQGTRARRPQPSTREAYVSDCRRLAAWFSGNGIAGPEHVTAAAMEAAFRALEWSPATRRRVLTAAREWLAGFFPPGRCPSDLVALPRVTAPPIPRLSQTDARRLAERSAAIVATRPARSGARALALRNHAIIELLYGSGLRRSEVCQLTLPSLDFEHELVKVVGKGGSGRSVPLTEPCVDALRAWLVEGRPLMAGRAPLTPRMRARVFLSRSGRPLDGSTVYRVVASALREAGRAGGPHLLRHAAATHLIEGGPDARGAHLRVVQELLGHASIATTQRYVGVTTRALHDALRAGHPRGRSRSDTTP